MRHNRFDRSAAAVLCLLTVSAAVAVVIGVSPRNAHPAEPEGDLEPVTEPRVCAAAAVYTLATADDWGQRAVIANTVLNEYAAGGPDCRPAMEALLSNEFSARRWQLALDAVDAVASGSYALPPGCIRANRVVPTPLWAGAVGPALHCSMGGLSFVQVAP